MHPLAALLALAATADTAGLAPRAAPRDSALPPVPGVVRRLEEVVVRAAAIGDPLASQIAHPLPREALRDLPLDRLADALALQAGVVATGEELHLRGGRAGDLRTTLGGVALDEPLRGRPMELPWLAIESAELVDGVMEARLGGAFAGVAQVRTVNPGSRPELAARWEGDGGIGNRFTRRTGFERYAARVSAPLRGGLGAVASADVLRDDTWLPALRSPSGWRADNRLLGFLKLGGGASFPLALEVLGSRRVERPFDPMWSLDGYTIPQTGPFGSEGPAFRTTPEPGYSRYRAADHQVMSDERRLAVVLSGRRAAAGGRLQGAWGWTESRRLVAVGGRDDESSLEATRLPVFGLPESDRNDPFLVYRGDEPFFQKSRAGRMSLRGDFERPWPSGSRYGLGAGLEYEQVEMRELDFSALDLRLDSLRAYRAFAPGGFAYLQGRWVHEGLVLNAGLRAEHFTAGPQARLQSFGSPARAHWSVSPRLGIAYPVSARDVVSLSYGRIHQSPARDHLYENRTRITQRQPLGNPGLGPATAISWELALRHLPERGGALQVSVFSRDLFGVVGARPLGPGLAAAPRYENADHGNAQGFEVSWIPPAGRRLRVEAHYTYLHAVGTQSLEEGLPQGPLLGPRTAPLGTRPLDWDRRHSLAFAGSWGRLPRPPAAAAGGPLSLALRGLRGAWSVSWATRIGSGLPWTASPRRQALGDWSQVNRRRFGWQEETALSWRWAPALAGGRLSLGIEARNLFDSRGDRAATISGFPHPIINTAYDDYGAFRGETGLPGGAYWDARDPAAPDAWVRVFDPRLASPPRRVRLRVETAW